MVSNVESKLLAYAIFSLIPLFLFYIAISSVSVSPIQIFVVTSLLVVMIVVTLTVKDVGVCQPYFVVVIVTLLGVHAKYLYIISSQGTSTVVNEILLLGQGQNVLDSGLVFILYAFTVMSLFYMVSKKRQFTKPLAIQYYIHSGKFVYLAVIILVLSLLSFSYLIVFNDVGFTSGKKFSEEGSIPDNRFSSISYYLLKISFLAKVSFYISLLSYLCHNKKMISLILLIISFFATVVISYYVSNRAGLVVLVLDFIVITSLYKGKVQLKLIFTALLILVITILVISANRSEVGATRSSADHIFGGRYLFDITKNAHFYNYLSSGNQLFDYSSTTLLSDYVNLGRFAGHGVFGMPSSGVPLGYPVELFAVGGWLALTIGMAVLGVFYRTLTLLVAKKVVKDYMIVVYSIVMTRSGVYLFNNGIGVTVYQTFLDLVPFLIVIFLLKPRYGGLLRTKMTHLKLKNE